MSDDKIVLTGIKPTGTPHIGNYIGALRPLVELSQNHKTVMFIADLHALNAIQDAKKIKQHSYEIAAIMIALGLNLDNTIFFRQSDVNEVYQLTEFLMNVTPKGLMDRAHSYKAMKDKNIAAGIDEDSGVNMGLYTYPILMAADILLYNSDLVPVGKDQKQHVEFARDIAGHFNNIYGDTFKLPEPVIGEDCGLIPGLDGRKMSKSYDNTIPLLCPSNELKKKVMRIITDSKTPEESKNPDESTIFHIYKLFANAEETAALRKRFLDGGMGYGEAKTILFEKIDSVLSEPRAKYEHLMANTKEIDEILFEGAERARKVASKTLAKVKKKMLGI